MRTTVREKPFSLAVLVNIFSTKDRVAMETEHCGLARRRTLVS